MRTQFPNHLTDLIEALREIKGHGSASLIAKSDTHERLTKKARSDKSPLPSWAEGLICLTRSVVNVNHVYEKAVKNQVAKNGFDPNNFQVEDSRVSKPIDGWPNTILREGLKNPDQLYVRVFVEMGLKTSVETFYLNGAGRDVTELVTEKFKEEFFPNKYGSEKQMLAGSAKEVKPREYKAENILYFKRGSTVFNQLSQDLYDLFNLE